jgi:Xaa-Pro aminopeptidase
MISLQEYQQRRQKLATLLPKDSIAVIPSASEYLRNGDGHYRFRQDSDFYYLTGFNEPDAVLVLIAGEIGESILFNRPRDFAEEQWVGERLGQTGACEQLGVQRSHPILDLQARLPEYFANTAAIFYPIGRYPAYDKQILDTWKQTKSLIRCGIRAPESIHDITPMIGEMRLLKSEAEIGLMREAARISVSAHQNAMRACAQLQFEYELEAILQYEMFRQGCRAVAYDSIVASGSQACVLHYTHNNQTLQPGKLILIDAGGEYYNYAADITRTFPQNGHFTPEQRAIYTLVLDAQKAGIACVRPGCIWDDIQQTIVRILTEGLVELGLLHGAVNDLIAQKAYSPFYMHRSGHWLGLDVHDSGAYKIDGNWRALEPGMVLTVEPGIYIHESIQGIDPRFHGIGVRIEDDILVTPNGHENLSAALPVDIDAIEALVRG